ncbi:MAG: aminoglycoside phosphotransferase family protein [Pseudomonadota bacterium]
MSPGWRMKLRVSGSSKTSLAVLPPVSAARVFAKDDIAVLLEWLPGPSLGDLVRAGEDRAATRHLGDVAAALRRAAPEAHDDYPKLETWFTALFDLHCAPACPIDARADIEACKVLARHLLATQTDFVALHGDLHHDNVRRGNRGWCAFDAKGVVGDPAYELANAFRNPDGGEAVYLDAGAQKYRASVWAGALGVSQNRLLAWAAVKCALSIAWRSEGPVADDRDFETLSILMHLARSSPEQP